jgi:hypothetical protein
MRQAIADRATSPGIVEALSWPFDAAMLRDIMLGWIRSRAFRGPLVVEIDHAADSDSTDALGSDPEESPLAEASPAMIGRGLFRLALQTRGLDMLGSESFIDLCEVLESRHRVILGNAPVPFLLAMSDTCGLQRQMFTDVNVLARKREHALDSTARECAAARLHPFVLYFGGASGLH